MSKLLTLIRSNYQQCLNLYAYNSESISDENKPTIIINNTIHYGL